MTKEHSTTHRVIVFQKGKLGHKSQIISDLHWAEELQRSTDQLSGVWGISGGSLAAIALGLVWAAQQKPTEFGKCINAIKEITDWFKSAKYFDLHAININPFNSPSNLSPIKQWFINYFLKHSINPSLYLSGLGIPVYLCAIDQDAVLNAFGPENPDLVFQYHFVQVGPPKDAPIIDALLASLSTMLSTEATQVNHNYYKDCRPAINHAAGIVNDIYKNHPITVEYSQPYTPLRQWKVNWVTSSFLMHSFSERNQSILTQYYLSLKQKHQQLIQIAAKIESVSNKQIQPENYSPIVRHVDLPYIGSTEAFTNMRQSVANKNTLMNRFSDELLGQLDNFPFHQPANIIYGAGGFSGILAGLVTTRKVAQGFEAAGGVIRNIYGVSAGVLNGFFHAIQYAANLHPKLYTSKAKNALIDLETFISTLKIHRIASINLNPIKFWNGWANLNPLKKWLKDRLTDYTGIPESDKITFDDIQLPLTVMVARNDGYPDFLGMSSPNRRLFWGEKQITPINAQVLQAIIAGWSMNTYINQTMIRDQAYQDGGGTYYDPAVLVACMDTNVINLLNIHLDEPEGHSYNLPPKPNLIQVIFDTHNYTFPEERRRMRLFQDAFFEHIRLRNAIRLHLQKLPADIQEQLNIEPDFHQNWLL